MTRKSSPVIAAILALDAALAGAAAAPLRPIMNFKGCTASSAGVFDCDYELIVHPVNGDYTGVFAAAFAFADSEIVGFTSSSPIFVQNASDGYCNTPEVIQMNDPDVNPLNYAVVGMQKATKIAHLLCADDNWKTVSALSAQPFAAQLKFKLDGNIWGGASPPRACAFVVGEDVDKTKAADFYCAHSSAPTGQCLPSPSNKEVFRAAMDTHYGDVLGAMPTEIKTVAWSNDPPRQVDPVPGHGGKAARLIKSSYLRYEPVAAGQSPFAFGSSPFSIDGWIKIKAAGSSSAIPILDTRSKNPSAGGVYVYMKNNQIIAEILDASGGALAAPVLTSAPSGVDNDVWRHFAVTVKRSSPAQVRMYLDGKPVDLQPIASTGAAVGGGKRMLIGRDSVTNDEGQTFQIDDLTIHHRVLLIKEVEALSKAPRCKVN